MVGEHTEADLSMWNRHSSLLDILFKALPWLSTLRKVRGHTINVQALNKKWTFLKPYVILNRFRSVPSSWYKKRMLRLLRATASTFCL